MMADYKLKPITENSWILHTNGNKLGMLIQNANGYKVIGSLDRKAFDNLEDLSQFLGGKITVEDVEQEQESEISDVDGYPIKHPMAYDIQLETYPSYTKVEHSSTRYAAGYYGVQFPNGWVSSYCPKITTLEDNKWIGPFRTRLEMLNAITQQKNAPRI